MQSTRQNKTGHEVNITMLTLTKNTLSTQATEKCVSNRPDNWSLIPLEEEHTAVSDTVMQQYAEPVLRPQFSVGSRHGLVTFTH